MKKTFYLTLLNVLSCFCVVMIHCNSVFWTAPAGTLWISANFIETACYFAVPVFFMVSGCTLFDYQERYSTKEYFHKRFWRTVFPFLVWSLLAYANQTRIAVRDGGTPDWNLMHIMDGILNIKYLQVYWFFIPLFSVYLSIPLLAGIKDKRSAFSYGAGMGIFFVAAMPLLSKLFHIPYNGGLTPGVVSGYLFLCWGMYWQTGSLEERNGFAFICLGSLAGRFIFGERTGCRLREPLTEPLRIM